MKKSHEQKNEYFRSNKHQWNPKNSAQNSGQSIIPVNLVLESLRVYPLSNWTELDIWQYILQESIEIVPLYFAAPRPTVKRDGQILMVDDKRFRLGLNEKPQIRSVRFRTLGCYPLTGAVLSKATKLTDIIEEMLLTILLSVKDV